MKTLYIFLTRSGTLLSNLVYSLTGAQYTHISLAFDEDLSTLYSSTRKNGYTMFPAGPSREYLNRLHKWKHQTLVSIAGGTLCYVLLVQMVF